MISHVGTDLLLPGYILPTDTTRAAVDLCLDHLATQMKYLKSLLYMLRNAKTGFLRCIDYPSFIKDRIKLDSLQILALVQLQNFQNY